MNVKSLLAMGLLLGMLGALSLNAMQEGGQLVEAAGDAVEQLGDVLDDAGKKVDELLPGSPVSFTRKCWNGTKRTTKYGVGVAAAVGVPYVGYYHGVDAVKWSWRKGKEAAGELTDTNTKRVILGGLGLLAWQNRSLRKSHEVQNAARVIKDGQRDVAIAQLFAAEVGKVTAAQNDAFAALEATVMGDQTEEGLRAAAEEHALILQAAEGFEGQAEQLRVLARWAEIHGKKSEWTKALQAGPAAEAGRPLSRVSSVASMSGLSEAAGELEDALPVVKVEKKKEKKEKKKKKEAAAPVEELVVHDDAGQSGGAGGDLVVGSDHEGSDREAEPVDGVEQL